MHDKIFVFVLRQSYLQFVQYQIDMVVSIKDAVKLIGISIITCCAVLVCTMFLNFYFDIVQIEDKIVVGSITK